MAEGVVALARLARRVRRDPVRPRAGDRRAARRGRRRRARAREQRAHPRRRAQRLLRPARGQRGIFVGGGGSARIPRLVGVACMTDMMLTGRVSTPRKGSGGLSQYLVDEGQGWRRPSSSRPKSPPTRRCRTSRCCRPAAHRRHGARRRAVRRVADVGDRAGDDGGQVRASATSSQSGKRGEGAEDDERAARGERGALPRAAARRLARGDNSTKRERRLDSWSSRRSRCSEYPRRLTDRFLHWARRRPIGPGRQAEQGGDWRKHQLSRSAGRRPLDRAGAARPAALGRAAARHPVRQRHRASPARPRRDARRRAVRADLAGLFDCVSQDHGKLRHIVGLLTPGLVFASECPAYGQARSRPRCRPTRRSCSARARSRAAPTDAVRRRCSRRRPTARSTPRTPRSAPTRSPSSCSRRARPSCPRA